ncbi:MAG TPA: hypothetical protein PKI19_12805 [Elusimicrobiales bacterium]|nr:hypothetical protein [Elusimicrobiales bacterium]
MSDAALNLLLSILPALIIAIILAGLTAAITHAVRSEKKKKEALKKLGEILPGELTTRGMSHVFHGDCKGTLFAVELQPGSRNEPPCLVVSVTAAPSFRLNVCREFFMSSAEKRLGLLQDMDTCDHRFNTEFIISADNQALAAPYLNDTQRRLDIWSFFNAGFRSFAIEQDGLRIRKPRYAPEADLQPAALAAMVGKLSLLAKAS